MEIQDCLKDSPAFQLIQLGTVDSTSNYLKNLRNTSTRRMTLVTAEFQTAGRGSSSNHWESQEGKNLLFSLLIHPTMIPAQRMYVLSEAIALAVRDALEQIAPGFCIKWPNDIYYKDRKVVGMLIENELSGSCVRHCILGVGINVNQLEFLSDAPNPASLAQIVGHRVEQCIVLAHTIHCFDHYYTMCETGHLDEVHQLYLSHLYRKNEKHGYRDANGTFQATLRDVEPTGHLVLEDESGQLRKYAFKEVQYII